MVVHKASILFSETGCLMSSTAGKEEFEDVQKTVEKKMTEKVIRLVVLFLLKTN